MVPKDIWLFTLGLLMAGAVDAAIPPVAWPADEFRLAKVPLVVAPPQDPTSAKKADVAEHPQVLSCVAAVSDILRQCCILFVHAARHRGTAAGHDSGGADPRQGRRREGEGARARRCGAVMTGTLRLTTEPRRWKGSRARGGAGWTSVSQRHESAALRAGGAE